ncbi:hypothetical protein M0R45_007114 [Rubus argutus]|uniref:Uncharacterized protein n=1 Tax=Rubus argutus TaxID=59490 RepID=A0AAW1YST4_RUBAR
MVEVTSPAMRESLIPGKMVSASANCTKFQVLFNGVNFKIYRKVTGHKTLRKEVDVALLRPLPAQEKDYAFKFPDTSREFSISCFSINANSSKFQVQDVSNTKEEKTQRMEDIGEGTQVEVFNDEDGFQGSL